MADQYDNGKTYQVGNVVTFQGSTYRMVEAAGAPGYAPNRPGDKLWKKESGSLFQRIKNRVTPQKPLDTNNTDATCIPGTADSTTFEQYVRRCRTAQDQQRANNFFSESIAQYRDSFQQLRAQFDDLIVSGNSMNSLLSLTGGTATAANNQINQLTQKRDMLKAEKSAFERKSQAADKSFLEEVMHGTPKPELAPGMDDVVLLLFWVSWLILGIALISVRTFSPMGGWASALFSIVIMLLITLCLYGVLKQVA